MEASSIEYSLRSDCLVVLEQGWTGEAAGHAHASAITVLDLAAGGRRLCRLRDFMCALHPPHTPPPPPPPSLHASWVRHAW